MTGLLFPAFLPSRLIHAHRLREEGGTNRRWQQLRPRKDW